jgi:fructose/tagatose bisphosphate aldolase
MPLITDPIQTREILSEVRELGVAMPAFCAEDERTQECILAGTLEKAKETGRADLPVIVACTITYPPRGQMKLYTYSGEYKLGLHAFFTYLDSLASEFSPYKDLRVLPCLDHGFPWLDGYALTEYAPKFSMVMHDASERPFDENIKLTAEYVEKMRDQVVIEGCVDEIVESGGAAGDETTTVENAQRFVSETGVDLIVANLGTEHRAVEAEKRYRSDRAKEISEALGRILVLHGTSCLKDEDLPKLASDGMVKINIYTILARMGGQAVARSVLDNLGNIFTESQLRELADQGYLGDRYFNRDYADVQCGGKIGPKLDKVAETPRRDAWVDCVKKQIKYYLDTFEYDRFAG